MPLTRHQFRSLAQLMNDPDFDPVLVEKANAGDRTAFDTLCRRYRPRLEGLIRLRLGPDLRQRVEVDDILQETLLKAFECAPRLPARDEQAFLGWLGKTAHHVILNQARRHRVRQMEPVEDRVLGKDATPSRSMAREERFERLQAALDGMTPEYREVILLTRIEGLRLKEVAERMERTPAAVAKLLTRALRQLREKFGVTESFHLPDRALRAGGGEDER